MVCARCCEKERIGLLEGKELGCLREGLFSLCGIFIQCLLYGQPDIYISDKASVSMFKMQYERRRDALM